MFQNYLVSLPYLREESRVCVYEEQLAYHLCLEGEDVVIGHVEESVGEERQVALFGQRVLAGGGQRLEDLLKGRVARIQRVPRAVLRVIEEVHR